MIAGVVVTGKQLIPGVMESMKIRDKAYHWVNNTSD
jgi:hypothetical protein